MDEIRIMDDKRAIKSVSTAGDDYSIWIVGKDDVNAIVPYEEHGQMATVTWLAIYAQTPYTENEIIARVNIAHVDQINYK